MLKPIWTYGIQLWGMASTFNTEMLERFQSKALSHISNMVIRRDLLIPTVKEEIRCYSSQYGACLGAHTKDLVVNLMVQPDNW
jgi:hypothetical protein